MSVKGGGGIPTYVKSSGVAGQTEPLEKKTLKPGQKGATMTLNSNSSGLAVGGTNSNGDSNSRSGGILPVPGASNSDNAETATRWWC